MSEKSTYLHASHAIRVLLKRATLEHFIRVRPRKYRLVTLGQVQIWEVRYTTKARDPGIVSKRKRDGYLALAHLPLWAGRSLLYARTRR